MQNVGRRRQVVYIEILVENTASADLLPVQVRGGIGIWDGEKDTACFHEPESGLISISACIEKRYGYGEKKEGDEEPDIRAPLPWRERLHTAAFERSVDVFLDFGVTQNPR